MPHNWMTRCDIGERAEFVKRVNIRIEIIASVKLTAMKETGVSDVMRR